MAMLAMNIPPREGELQSEMYIDTTSATPLYSSQRAVSTSVIDAKKVS